MALTNRTTHNTQEKTYRRKILSLMSSKLMKNIAISGASSFTALWIANALNLSGLMVHGLCTRESLEKYSGLPRRRLELGKNWTKYHYSIRAEDGSMANWIRTHKPEVWIHHHHFMTDFRSLNYDLTVTEQIGIEPLEGIVLALKAAGTQSVIYSGSYFEPGEGAQDSDYRATPYACSKQKVWIQLSELCQKNRIACHKIVIPNPIGPLENEDRLIPNLLKHSFKGTPMLLRSPSSSADNISVFDLAALYVELANNSGVTEIPIIRRPSQWVETNSTLVNECCKILIENELGIKSCPIEGPQNEIQPSHFKNSESLVASDRTIFWKKYVAILKSEKYLNNDSGIETT